MSGDQPLRFTEVVVTSGYDGEAGVPFVLLLPKQGNPLHLTADDAITLAITIAREAEFARSDAFIVTFFQQYPEFRSRIGEVLAAFRSHRARVRDEQAAWRQAHDETPAA
jgi:hypothetical protein